MNLSSFKSRLSALTGLKKYAAAPMGMAIMRILDAHCLW